VTRPNPPQSDGSSNRSGCLVMAAIVGVVVLFTVWPMLSAWSAVSTFERTALDAGYTLVQGTGVALVTDSTPTTPTYFRAVDSAQVLGGADADIAVSSADAVLDGIFRGNVAFLGKELTILPGAVIMGDLEIAAAKYVTVRGEVVGEIRGEYRRLFRPQPTPPADPAAEEQETANSPSR